MSEHHVVIERLCSCLKERNIDQIVTCNDPDEAYDLAYELSARFNDICCGKHGFDVEAVDENFVITVAQGGYCESCEI